MSSVDLPAAIEPSVQSVKGPLCQNMRAAQSRVSAKCCFSIVEESCRPRERSLNPSLKPSKRSGRAFSSLLRPVRNKAASRACPGQRIIIVYIFYTDQYFQPRSDRIMVSTQGSDSSSHPCNRGSIPRQTYSFCFAAFCCYTTELLQPTPARPQSLRAIMITEV